MTDGVGAKALAFGFAAVAWAMAGDMAFAGSQCGKAAWYDLEGMTASGEQSDGNVLAAAHRTLPFGSRVKVENLRNGRTVIVRVNDRGPFVGGRVIDVTRAAAEKLGFIDAGIARVRVTALDSKGGALVGDCGGEALVAEAKPAARKKAVVEKTRKAPPAPAPTPVEKAVVAAVPTEPPVEPVEPPPKVAESPPEEAKPPTEAAKPAAPVTADPAETLLPKEAEIVAAARRAALVIPPKVAAPVKPKRAAVVSVPYEETPIEEETPDNEAEGDVDPADSAERDSAADDVAAVEAAASDALSETVDIPLPRLRPGTASVDTASTQPADTRFGGAFQPDLTRFVHAFQPDDYNAIRTVKDLPFTLLGLE